MFESDLSALGDAALLDAGAEARAIQDRADLRFTQVALAFADRNHEPYCPTTGEIVPGAERVKVYGGEGCPGVAEFAPAEFGARFGMAPVTASSFIGDCLGLRHRLPRVWARVQTGQAQAWRGRQIAHATQSLSPAAAAAVDARVADIVNTLSTYRLVKIIKGVLLAADPDAAQRAADELSRSRGVWIKQSDEHGTKAVWARAAAGDVIRFDAMVNDIAEALADQGDTDTLDQRRAKAIGWLADPEAATELRTTTHQARRARKTDTGGDGDPDDPDPATTPDQASTPDQADGQDQADAPDPADGQDWANTPGGVVEQDRADESAPASEPAPADSVGASLAQRLADIKARARGGAPHTVYVHLTDETLATGHGALRAEGIGPLLASQLAELLGHDKVIVKPVIDLRDNISVDAYDIPDRIRERVRLQQPASVFPWSNHETTTRTDLDHINPYDRTGPPGQTSTQNLGPLTRLEHRLKTHGGWAYRRLPNGGLDWTSPRGNRYRVDRTGTRYLGNRNTNTNTNTATDTALDADPENGHRGDPENAA